MKEYYTRPAVMKRKKQYRATPAAKEYMRKYMHRYLENKSNASKHRQYMLNYMRRKRKEMEK